MQSPSRPRLRIPGLFARLFAISVSTVSAFAAPFAITEILPPPGLNLDSVVALTPSGKLATILRDPSRNQPDGVKSIALWSESQGFTLIPDFGNGSLYVQQFTDSGFILGSITAADFSSTTPFVWSASLGLRLLQPAGYDYFVPVGISEAGVVAGAATSLTSGDTLLVWDPAGGFRELGSLGGSSIFPYTITTSGTVVGTANRADGTSAVFVWDAINGLRDISANSMGAGAIANSDSGLIAWLGYEAGTGARTFFTWDATRGTRSFAPPTDYSWFTPNMVAPKSGGGLFVGSDMFSGTFVIDTDSLTITAFKQFKPSTPGNARNQFATTDASGALLISDRLGGGMSVPLPVGWLSVDPQYINNSGLVFGQAVVDSQTFLPFVWSQADGFQLLNSPDSVGGYAHLVQESSAVILNLTADSTPHFYFMKLPTTEAGKPDLQITGLTITPDPKKTPASSKGKGKGSEKESDDDSKNAKTATIKVFVANKGTGAAVASSTTLADGKKVFATLATPTIPAGQSVTLTYSWDLKKVEEGKHTLTATADSAAVVTETNEANNTLKVVFTVKED